MRVCAIDIGTNSVRLLVADLVKDRVIPLETDLITTRLGEKINCGFLQEKAVLRTLNALESFLSLGDKWQAEKTVACATSAVRDAQNGADFTMLVRKKLDLAVRVLSGEEEARLSHQGVCSGLDIKGQNPVVMDLGGGSTEFIWEHGGQIEALSVRAGAVRMTEARLGTLQMARILRPAVRKIRTFRPGLMVGVGGTATTACAMKLGLVQYDSRLVHGQTLSLGDVVELAKLVQACPLEKRRHIPGLMPERADIIPAGLTLMALALRGLGMEAIKVSETDILYGMVLNHQHFGL